VTAGCAPLTQARFARESLPLTRTQPARVAMSRAVPFSIVRSQRGYLPCVGQHTALGERVVADRLEVPNPAGSGSSDFLRGAGEDFLCRVERCVGRHAVQGKETSTAVICAQYRGPACLRTPDLAARRPKSSRCSRRSGCEQ
jgi:hypothetical protein